MRRTKLQRVACLLLCFFLLACGGTFAVGAQDLTATSSATGNNNVTDKSIEDYRRELGSITYSEYMREFSSYENATDTVVLDAIGSLDSEGTTLRYLTDDEWEQITQNSTLASSIVGIYETEYDGVKALYTPGSGTVSFRAKGVKEGLYSIRIVYYPVEGKAASIEREFYINGTTPFKESRTLTLPKLWQNVYTSAEIRLSTKQNAQELLDAAKTVGVNATSEVRDDGTYMIVNIPDVWTQGVSEYFNTLTKKSAAIRFFTTDKEDNELRPATKQTPEWLVCDLRDNEGQYAESFQYVITPDKNGDVLLTLKGVNEPMAISQIMLIPHDTLPTYDSYINKYKNAPLGESTIKIEAEYPSQLSTNTVYPTEDRASAATSPADTSRTVLNTIGGEKWGTAGQSISYRFRVDKTGLYSIDMRFRQNVLDGLFVSRSLSLYSDGLSEGADGYYNGYPFSEAVQCRFNYSGYWQSTSMNNGTRDEAGNLVNYQFYFVEGVTYTLKLEVSLGTMAPVLDKIQASLNSINDDYLTIMRLTGSSPDAYRDYHFSRVMPTTLADMAAQAKILEQTAEELKAIAGSSSSSVGTIIKIAKLLEKMSDEDEIARNMKTLKSYIGSLGTLLTDAKNQPLQLDYIVIQAPGSKLPTAEPNFLRKIVHEVSAFVRSFLRDYNSMGAMEDASEDALTVWVAYGRDQSQVIRNLITNDFTYNTGIPVDLKLVSGGTLLPSILAGMGPDVYLGLGQGDVINYAIRGALTTLDVDSQGNVREDFAEVTKEFNDAAMLVLGMENSQGDIHYYGLPETQSFPMMFVRVDILAELDIEIPRTWDDIYMAQTILEGNSMEIGLTKDYKMFLYQSGGSLFADGGMRINLDSAKGLKSFETMCNLFTMHSFPYEYNAANRFRTGEMPIVVADYTGMYNQLKVFATEIEGLWTFVPLPGTVDENGNINNSSISSVVADIIVTGSKHEDAAWEYLKWYTGADCQTAYANDMVAIIGDSAKHPTANRTALSSMPWTASEYAEIQKQFENLASIPNYPGSYYIDRYTNFALLAAYNEDADPTTELLSYINTINKEITRKRKEFLLETLEIGQTLAAKRGAQALEALGELNREGGYNDIIAGVTNALADENILVIEDYSRILSEMLKNADADSYTVRVSRQDQETKNGGYKISDLDHDQLIYFAAQCLADAATALRTY